MAGGSDGNKKFAIVGVSSVLLVALCAAVAIGVIHSTSKDSNDESGVSTSQKASVHELCNSTDYKDTCEKSLEPAARNSSNPRDLIRGGFNYAMDELRGVLKNSSVLNEAEKDPRTKEAYETCKELVERSIDEFTDSFDKMGNFDLTKLSEYTEDLKTWLTAAMSHQEACLDAFENTTGNAGENMKKLLNSTREITSNGLAMVTEFGTLSGDLSKQIADVASASSSARKLLSIDDGFPSWVNEGHRRLLQATPGNIEPDAIVAMDGSGQFKTITEALNTVPKKNTEPFVIYVKAGIYQEEVIVGKKVNNVMLLGDGPTKTKITGSKNFIDGTVTFKTATFAVTGSNFIAKNIGFENSAGAAKHQAVALRVGGDHSIFYNCQMDGYQDTLYTHSHRQFYRDCTISGTIDFVFGDAEAVLQNCKLVVRQPMANQNCIVTAQGRGDRKENSALVLQNCTISGDPAYIPNKLKNRAFLGRPWKPLSRTIIMNSQIDDIIAPEGWLPWQGTFGINTCFYGEYNNRGPGSQQTQRVKWPCIQKISSNTAESFTPGVYIGGDTWIPSSGIPYTAGMINV